MANNFRLIILFLLGVAGSFVAMTLIMQTTQETRRGEPASRYFNGSQFVQSKTLDVQPPYTIDAILKSDPVKLPDPLKYDEKNPPMPLAIQPLGIYLDSKGYSLQDGKARIARIEKPTHWRRITLVVNELNAARLFLNGKTIWQGRIDKPIKKVTVGRGYPERYWKGEVRLFKISKGLLYDNDFDASETILRQGVTTIYQLPIN